ncbi:MAG TPA: hypothetical protein PKD00_02265 [Burkholderiales bacterium]|nr:hypothetical protein [Burkholderiales bacterium]
MFKQLFLLLISSFLFSIKLVNAQTVSFTDTYQHLSDVTQGSIWNNVMYNTYGYTDTNAIVLSLATIDNILLLGNTNLPGVSGARNIWQLNGNAWSNLSNTWINYHRSAPATILPISLSETVIGYFDGSVQDCHLNVCNYLILNQHELGFGVSSLLHLNNNYFIGYTDINLGNNGQLTVYQEANPGISSQQFNVKGINSGVGKMATDYNYVYVPTKANGVLKVSLDGVNMTNITPVSLQNKEFVSVLYYVRNINTLYAGTSLANVYKVKLPINNGGDWVKLTNNSLSAKSYVSAIVTDNKNNLYVGLANLFAPENGGELYMLKNGENEFYKEMNYTDKSSISSMIIFNNNIYIATFAGNIWRN